MYKSVTFLKARKYEDWPLFHRAIDWVENKGILTPVTVVVKPKSTDQTEGRFRPNTGRIYLYRAEPQIMELALVHELIHAWQWDGEVFRENQAFKMYIRGSNKRERYLLDPCEVEAYHYMNAYSLEYYGENSPYQKEYTALGINLSHLGAG